MINVLKTASALFVVLGFSSTAMASYLSCTNGTIDEVGDAYYQIDILEDGIQFRPYESSFDIDAVNVDYQDLVYTITDVETVVYSEGTETNAVIDATLKLSPDFGTLAVSLSENKAPAQNFVLKCVEKN